jgi:hypothetical protein
VENNQFENFKIYVKNLDELIEAVEQMKSTSTNVVNNKLVTA